MSDTLEYTGHSYTKFRQTKSLDDKKKKRLQKSPRNSPKKFDFQNYSKKAMWQVFLHCGQFSLLIVMIPNVKTAIFTWFGVQYTERNDFRSGVYTQSSQIKLGFWNYFGKKPVNRCRTAIKESSDLVLRALSDSRVNA